MCEKAATREDLGDLVYIPGYDANAIVTEGGE
jgi:hypothetical protein